MFFLWLASFITGALLCIGGASDYWQGARTRDADAVKAHFIAGSLGMLGGLLLIIHAVIGVVG